MTIVKNPYKQQHEVEIIQTKHRNPIIKINGEIISNILFEAKLNLLVHEPPVFCFGLHPSIIKINKLHGLIDFKHGDKKYRLIEIEE